MTKLECLAWEKQLTEHQQIDITACNCSNGEAFLARDSIYAIARYMPSPVRLSVCLSLCPSHGWISQRRLKLGLRNLHHRVAP